MDKQLNENLKKAGEATKQLAKNSCDYGSAKAGKFINFGLKNLIKGINYVNSKIEKSLEKNNKNNIED